MKRKLSRMSLRNYHVVWSFTAYQPCCHRIVAIEIVSSYFCLFVKYHDVEKNSLTGKATTSWEIMFSFEWKLYVSQLNKIVFLHRKSKSDIPLFFSIFVIKYLYSSDWTYGESSWTLVAFFFLIFGTCRISYFTWHFFLCTYCNNSPCPTISPALLTDYLFWPTIFCNWNFIEKMRCESSSVYFAINTL